MAAGHKSAGRGWLDLKVIGPTGLAVWQQLWVELRFETEDGEDKPPRPSDPKPKKGRSELQVYEFSQQNIEEERIKAQERLDQLEREFATFQTTDDPDMTREEYNLLDRSFKNRITREKVNPTLQTHCISLCRHSISAEGLPCTYRRANPPSGILERTRCRLCPYAYFSPAGVCARVRGSEGGLGGRAP